MGSNIRLALAILAVVFVAGCSSSTHPSDTPGLAMDGRFGFVWNGGIYMSKTNLFGSSTDVQLTRNFGFGVDTNTTLLFISLQYDFIDVGGSYRQIVAELGIPILNPVSQNAIGTYTVGAWDNPVLVSGGVLVYPVQYNSVAGGKVTITKFDTVNNLISGTFNFSTEIERPTSGYPNTASISSGFFNDVSISSGGYNVGSISMDVDGYPFTTHSGDHQDFVAYRQSTSPSLRILAFDNSGSQRELQFSIPSPHAGNISLVPIGSGSLNANQAWTNYSDGTGSFEVSGTNGELIITKYDQINRRFSGTFSFTGTDPSSGDRVTITNGIIDNLQWAVN